MGTDDLFKKRRAERKKRKFGYKRPRANSYLIVTEGKRTEPLYFNGMKKLIQARIGGTVDIVELPVIHIQGEGCSTGKLIEKTDEIVSRSKIMYQNIWIVFDKDDFEQAIRDGEERGYKIAWSNQAFEYWLYLHFYYSDTALHREQWKEKLDEIFKQYGLGDGQYHKNQENIYELVNTYDGVNTAIKNAKRRMNEFFSQKELPSEFDPGMTVHLLAEELKRYLEEL